MARAKRHYIFGHVWNITHRCHKKDFLLKNAKDRHRWLQWLYEARKRYNLVILDYVVTLNHVYLLVQDANGRKVIPKARRVLCYIAVRKMGYQCTEVSKALDISAVAVSKAASLGSKLSAVGKIQKQILRN